MIALLCLFLRLLASPFKSTSQLEAENAALRHQLIAMRRKFRGRAEFTNGDRLFFILLYRWFPSTRPNLFPSSAQPAQWLADPTHEPPPCP
jgi:hypothetical protein